MMRLALILLGAYVLFQIFQQNSVWLLLGAVFLLVVGFAFLVLRQSRLEKIRAYKRALLKVNENEVLVLESRQNMYADGAEYEDPKHAYVSDLDIFGPQSLFALINRCATKEGEGLLASWLLRPSKKEDIVARQRATKELAGKKEWIQQLQAKLLFNLGQKVNIKSFLTRYMRDDSLRFGSSFMRFYVKVVPYIFLLGVGISLWMLPLWNFLLALAVVHLLWTMALGGKVSYFSSRIDKIGVTLMAYADAVEMVEKEPFEAPHTVHIRQVLKSQRGEALSTAFKQLGQLIDKLDTRNNILIGSLLNMLLLWDFRQVLAILEWKKKYEENILQAFEVIAEMEALASLAILRNNYPRWVEPQILESPQNDHLCAKQLCHPLIAEEVAVANDYDAHDHTLALITGSNMAGKSTFLRTVGINAVLAYAGAVVCAEDFKLPIYSLVTYMRIKDSLNESTSTFKAELDRMRYILDKLTSDSDTFVLIDEMLRGTNSVDKYLGSKAIIKKILALRGKGMVATHDLQLAALEEEYKGLLKNYHFDIQVIEGEMLFDYKLKEGKCTIFNASLLLKGIGIDVQDS